jgi:glycosyltransferase involved in cell wall biosynthesis
MHIAIDALLVYGEFSGVQHAILHQIRALLNLNTRHHFTIVCLEDVEMHALIGRVKQPYSLLRAPVPSGARVPRILWEQVTMPDRLHTMGIDVLYAPGYLQPLRWEGRSVVFVHDTIALSHPELCTLGNALHYRLLLPPSSRKATRVAVPSTASARDVEARCGVPAERIRVVPLGVVPPRVPTPAEISDARAAMSADAPYLLAVSTIEPKKNFDSLIRWFDRWKDAGVPHHLVIVGKWGWKTDAVRKALDTSRYREAIHLPGYRPQDALPPIIAAADLLLMPSRYEGFGLPALEAMAVGTPVVASDRGALPETVGDAGLVLPLDDAAWADGVPALLADPTRLALMRDAGRAHAAVHTWAATAALLMAVFEEIAPPEREHAARPSHYDYEG